MVGTDSSHLRTERIPSTLVGHLRSADRGAGSAGPSNIYKVDGVDGGSYWIPAIGTMNFNARFLVDNLISLELFKAHVGMS